MGKQKKKLADNQIATNKKARHDYFIEDKIEAGLVLEGWEVKSLRSKNVQLRESYILIKNSEAWLFGAHVSPLLTASTHISPDPTRSRKLLMHRREIDKLIGAIERKGYTAVPLQMYWKRGRAKVEIGIAKGKELHDKRTTQKNKDWEREKERLFKHRQ